jgi:hypothetical protein
MRRRVLPHAGQVEINFFDIPSVPRTESGGLDIGHAVRDTLTDVLSAAKLQGMDREEVCAQIARLSNFHITKPTMNNYCAPSAEQRHFPLEALPALTVATGDFRLLELIAEKCGCRILRGDEAVVAELGALAMQEKAIKDRVKNINSRLPSGAGEKLSAEALKRLGIKS